MRNNSEARFSYLDPSDVAIMLLRLNAHFPHFFIKLNRPFSDAKSKNKPKNNVLTEAAYLYSYLIFVAKNQHKKALCADCRGCLGRRA